MFRVKSSFKRELEIKAPLAKVRDFFANLSNLADMLWGIEGIHREPGLARWTIATDTPVGRIRFSFPVRDTSPNLNTIEWSPAINETQNLLRYSLKFENSNDTTRVDISQQVELRRKRAWELHPGVAFMSEARLNSALQRRIDAAVDDFLVRVKEKLEGSATETPRHGD